MTGKKKGTNRMEQLLAESRAREKTYREQALKMYPRICARCGRSFEGIRLRELTVHHIDHDHDNNPPDGSNWELLCLYCHENEHNPYQYGEATPGGDETPRATFQPFAGLESLLKDNEE